jgi:hypothetical protein
MEIFIAGLIIISIGVIVHSSYKVVGTPKKNRDERIESLEEDLNSFDAKMISAEKSKRSDCPYMAEFNTDDGSLYIPYRVKYIFNDNEKEG